MAKEKMIKKANSKGITLVALVVTIVVLLILAGITITALFGENGIISQAQKAKTATEQDEKNTQKGLANLAEEIDKLTGNYDKETGWNLDKVKIAKNEGKNIPVPIGYSLSQATGENKVSTGLVLYQDIEGKEGSKENIVNDDNKATARTSRNQFVWVPVPDVVLDETKTVESGTYTPMAKLQGETDENYMGMLYTFSGTSATSYAPGSRTYREPDVVVGSSGSDYDAKSTYLEQAGLPAGSTANDFKKQLQKEFNSMVKSVEKYKGFYIGRYETGNISSSDTNNTPVVQKGNTKLGGLNWYYQYKNSKNIAKNKNNVTSSMIWGCQWDATLRWFQSSTDSIVKNFPTDKTSKYGNYSDNKIDYIDADGNPASTTEGTETVIPTGSAEITKINNIYDMAGNAYDWTIEAYIENYRIVRRR